MKKDFYRAFEDQFRGSRELVRSRLEVYLDFLRPLAGAIESPQAVDLGCGRGEFLEILQTAGYQARGVDLDEGMLKACIQYGLPAERNEALAFLKGLPAESQAVVSAFHLIEHISFEQLQLLVAESYRVLVPGGIMILETPNPENLSVASCSFHLDPTHQKMIPPLLLSFLAEQLEFKRVKVLRLQEPKKLDESNDLGITDVLFRASPDYSVVAEKDGHPQAMAALERVFSKNYGLTTYSLAEKLDALSRKNYFSLKEDQNFLKEKVLMDDQVINKALLQISCKLENSQERADKVESLLESLHSDLRTSIAGIHATVQTQMSELSQDHKRVEAHLLELGTYLGRVQDIASSPWLNYLPTPFSWPVLLFKARSIRRPDWFPRKAEVKPDKKNNLWRRIEQSLRKRRKRIMAAWDFDVVWYRQEYPDVRSANINPLLHFIEFGEQEGRKKNLVTKGGYTAFSRMTRAFFWRAPVPKIKLKLQKIDGIWWLLTIISQEKHESKLDGSLRITFKRRVLKFNGLPLVKNNQMQIKVLLKLPAMCGLIKIRFQSEASKQCVVLRKIIRVFKEKDSQQQEILGQRFDLFADVSSQRASSGFWRRLEQNIRKKRKELLAYLTSPRPQDALVTNVISPARPFAMSSKTRKIFSELRGIRS